MAPRHPTLPILGTKVDGGYGVKSTRSDARSSMSQ